MKFNLGLVIGVALFIWVITSSCVYHAEYHPPCPVCDESYASEEHLDSHCATNWEEPEDPLEAIECATCGIYFNYADYGEHIKTCCP